MPQLKRKGILACSATKRNKLWWRQRCRSLNLSKKSRVQEHAAQSRTLTRSKTNHWRSQSLWWMRMLNYRRSQPPKRLRKEWMIRSWNHRNRNHSTKSSNLKTCWERFRVRIVNKISQRRSLFHQKSPSCWNWWRICAMKGTECLFSQWVRKYWISLKLLFLLASWGRKMASLLSICGLMETLKFHCESKYAPISIRMRVFFAVY